MKLESIITNNNKVDILKAYEFINQTTKNFNVFMNRMVSELSLKDNEYELVKIKSGRGYLRHYYTDIGVAIRIFETMKRYLPNRQARQFEVIKFLKQYNISDKVTNKSEPETTLILESINNLHERISNDHDELLRENLLLQETRKAQDEELKRLKRRIIEFKNMSVREFKQYKKENK